MNRPRYETQANRNNEEEVMAAVAARTRLRAEKLPQAYQRLDSALVAGDGVIEAFCEVKCRSHPSTQFHTLILSFNKWVAGRQYAEASVPFLLVARFSDGVFVYRYRSDHRFKVCWGGRTVRTRDSADVEPVVHVPVPMFVRLEDFCL